MPPNQTPLQPEKQPTAPAPASPPSMTLAAPIATPEGVGIQINDVNKSVWHYIKERKKLQILLFVPATVAWEAMLVLLVIYTIGHQSSDSSSNSSGGRGFGYAIMAPFMVYWAWIYRLRKQFEDVFLQEFAAANGYTFDKLGTVDETYGTIFRIAGSQHVSDVVSGTYRNASLRLFLYELTIQQGRSSQRYPNTVIELDLAGNLPNLLMLNKHGKLNHLNIAKSFSFKNKIKLEGDFNEYFDLYAPPGNEIEALEVFAPDTMALMEDHSSHYSVEFAANRVYIYVNGFVGTTQDITQLFALAKQLIDKIQPLAGRLAKDSAITATPINLNSIPGYKPPKRRAGLVVSLLLLGSFLITVLLVSVAIRSSHQNTTSTYKPSTPSYVADAPYCGVSPGSGSSTAANDYIDATITLNTARSQISDALKARSDGTVGAAEINETLAADAAFIKSLQAITFPTNAQVDAANLIQSVKNYDDLITLEEKGAPLVAGQLDTARTTRSSSSGLLRGDLGLPATTCSFLGP